MLQLRCLEELRESPGRGLREQERLPCVVLTGAGHVMEVSIYSSQLESMFSAEIK